MILSVSSFQSHNLQKKNSLEKKESLINYFQYNYELFQ